RRVAVDPGTGRVRGRVVYDRTLVGWADAMHRSMLLGIFGERLVELAAWPVTWVQTFGYGKGTAAQFDYIVLLNRLTFPYLLFISLVSLLGGILNSLHRFW
ncbi:hypothetical protein LTR94_036299, partial [Friedmanniomyces endolithicus]